MKTFIAALVAVAALSFAGVASAETYWGVGVSQARTSVESLDLNDGYALDLTVGTSVDTPVGALRLEGAVTRQSNDTNFYGITLNTKALEASGSVFYDIPTGTSVTPYVGAGVTYTQAQARVLFNDIDANGWGYQLAAGARTQLVGGWTADVGVRYGKSTLDADYIGDVDVENTRLRIGFTHAL